MNRLFLTRHRPLVTSLLALFLISSSASALVMRENGPEPVIVQIKESLRLSDDLDNHLDQLASTCDQNGLQVVKRWAGSKFLILLSFPSNFTGEDAWTAIKRIKQLPAVEKVVPASAFNLHFRSGDFKREYTPSQTIPDVARRGLDADQIGRTAPGIPTQASLNDIPHVPNRLIVRWKDEHIWNASATGFDQVMSDLHRETGCRVVRETRYSPTKLTQVLEFDDPNTLADKIRGYLQSDLVVYAQPDFIYQTEALPNDPWYANFPGPQWTLPIISASSAWSMTTGLSSVIIAVADSGANVAHPDFVDNIWNGQNSGYHHNFVNDTSDVTDDFAPEYHGSAVASIIGAQGNNNPTPKAMAGVAWDTSLMILKVVNSTGHCSSSVVAAAIHYAATQGATAINLSLGFYASNCKEGPPLVCTEGLWYDDDLEQALRYARDNNMVTVSAAGNRGQVIWPNEIPNGDNDINFNRLSPASIPTDNNISVLATNVNDNRASYSSYGKYRVDLAAPGGEQGLRVPSLRQASNDPPTAADRNLLYGTSAAAPHVTGALALVKSLYPWENYLGLRDRVLMGTDPIPGATPGVEGKCRTNGRLNLYKALQPRSMLLNLSTRARVEDGDKVMIAGFIIGGSASGGSIEVVMRGIGPSLDGTPGITDPLGDPVIELYRESKLEDSNDNWGDDPHSAALEATGLQPSDSTEAAMIRWLGPGEYTVILRTATGSQSDFGVGLVELYALGDSEESRFKNISTRCLVGTGENVAIAGTIIDSPSLAPVAKPDRRVLIFGKGPSLQLLGMAPGGILTDPYLQIDGGTNNDNWATLDDDSGSQDALDEELVEADFAPTHASESALWPTFRPGAHTVILSGINQSTGIGLIEFYEY